jgi:hypothetical protein
MAETTIKADGALIIVSTTGQKLREVRKRW